VRWVVDRLLQVWVAVQHICAAAQGGWGQNDRGSEQHICSRLSALEIRAQLHRGERGRRNTAAQGVREVYRG